MSVVLIFHDDERFLPEAIAGVFSQTYTDWELVLVDDGSVDASTAIARDWAARHPERVHYLDHPGHANLGISATRNRGWRSSRGRYVALLDSDDVWEPEKLAEQVAILDTDPEVGLVVGASLYWWSWAGPDAPSGDRLKPVGAAQDRSHPPASLLSVLYPLGRGVAPCPSSCIVRREVLERVGGFEERFRGLYEDQAFLVKAYHDTTVWISSRCWDRYRRHPEQIVASTSEDAYHAIRRDFLTWYEEYLRASGITDRRCRRSLQRAWWPYRHPRLAALRRAVGRARARLRSRRPSVASDRP